MIASKTRIVSFGSSPGARFAILKGFDICSFDVSGLYKNTVSGSVQEYLYFC